MYSAPQSRGNFRVGYSASRYRAASAAIRSSIVGPSAGVRHVALPMSSAAMAGPTISSSVVVGVMAERGEQVDHVAVS